MLFVHSVVVVHEKEKKNSPRGAPQIKKLERASLEQIALKSRLTLGTTTLAEKRQRPFPSANKTQPNRAEERNAWRSCMVRCAVPRSTGSRRVRRLEERGVQLYGMFGTGLRPTGLRKAASFQIREVILEQRPRRCPCFAAGNPAQLSFHERRCAEFGDGLCRVDFPQHACALYPTPPEAKGHRLIPTCLPLDIPPNTTSGSVSGSSSSLSNSIQLLYPVVRCNYNLYPLSLSSRKSQEVSHTFLSAHAQCSFLCTTHTGRRHSTLSRGPP